MTGVQSVTGERPHAPRQAFDGDLSPAIQRLLKTSVALLGAEEATLQLYDETGRAVSTFTAGRWDKTTTPVGQVQDHPGSDGVGRSLHQVATGHSPPLHQSNGDSALYSKQLVDSSGRRTGVLTARFSHSHDLSDIQTRAFDFSAEALGIVISCCEREEQARASVDSLTRRNAELESSNTRLVQSNRDLERFAMAAGHDLKEPLRTIALYAQLLLTKHTAQLDSDAAGLINCISQSAESISALLHDLMTYAEVETGGDGGVLPAVDLNQVVEKAIRNVAISAAECGAAITADPLPSVAAHEIHVLQLFQNLLSNAIKHRGAVAPRIHITSLSTPRQIELIVSDNGLGIDPQYHSRIFEPFRRLRSNERSGTGLGLTICRRIVSRYGGRIWVESQNSAGAAFHFTLPNALVARAPVTTTQLECPGAGTPKILIVDNNPADVTLFRLALEEAALGCQLTVIDDGAAALTYLGQAANGNPALPDMIVLDLHLPKYDGIEILEAMAATAALTAVPVLVWGSVMSPRDREALRRFPLVTSMSKPSALEDCVNVGLNVQELLRGELRRSQSL